MEKYKGKKTLDFAEMFGRAIHKKRLVRRVG